jgi:hypothetical protein
METKPGKTRVNKTEIYKTLKLLEYNNFNYLQTSRETNIHRTTIKRWEKLYGGDVFLTTPSKSIASEIINAEMVQKDIHVLRYLYALRKRSLHKISIMAEKESRIEPLLSVLKYVSSEIDKFAEIDKAEKTGNTVSPLSFIAHIEQQIKARNQSETMDHSSDN